MIFKKAIFVFLSTFCFFGLSAGQECVPSVTTLTLAANATLFWETSPEETECPITNFTVRIVGDLEDAYQLTVFDHFVDLSFLLICERWTFVVTPNSLDVVGYPHILSSYIPLPPDTDLNLSYFSFNISHRTVVLEWDLANRTQLDCSLQYRVTVEDQDRGVTDDYYFEGKSATLPNISPCIAYTLTIRAINQAHPTIEGPLRTLYMLLNPRVQVAPTLQSIDVQPTTIDTTWNLEGHTNRCPLSSFHIDGGAFFNSTVSLQNAQTTTVSVHIDSLLPDRMYLLRASVENSGGRSPSVSLGVQTPELSPN